MAWVQGCRGVQRARSSRLPAAGRNAMPTPAPASTKRRQVPRRRAEDAWVRYHAPSDDTGGIEPRDVGRPARRLSYVVSTGIVEVGSPGLFCLISGYHSSPDILNRSEIFKGDSGGSGRHGLTGVWNRARPGFDGRDIEDVV